MEPEIINNVLQSLLDQIAGAYGNLLPIANYFFYAFASINLVKLGLSSAFNNNSNIIADLLLQLFKMSFMLWVINYLPYLHEVLRDGAIKLGLKAAGSISTIDLILNPSEIAGFGFKAIVPILEWLKDMRWGFRNAGINLANALGGFVAILAILVSFFYMAYQMLMALVDFYLSSVLAPLFLAFKTFEPTAWIGSSAIKGPIQHAVKLFTMAFILSISTPWIDSLVSTHALEGMSQAGSLVLASIVLVGLAFKVGTWSASILSGSPNASAGDLVSSAGALAGVGVVGSYASKAAMQTAQRTMSAVSGGAIATGAAAVTGARLGASSYSGSSTLGKISAGTVGASKGVAGVAMATPKAIQDRIAKSFRESSNQGIRQSFGANETVGSNANKANTSSGQDAMRKAQLYKRIADAFKERNSNEH